MLLLIMNGKFGGGRINMSPMALLNDGLLDITLQHGPANVKEIVNFFRDAAIGRGAHIHRNNYATFRGQLVKIVNQNVNNTSISSNDLDNLGIADN